MISKELESKINKTLEGEPETYQSHEEYVYWRTQRALVSGAPIVNIKLGVSKVDDIVNDQKLFEEMMQQRRAEPFAYPGEIYDPRPYVNEDKQ